VVEAVVPETRGELGDLAAVVMLAITVQVMGLRVQQTPEEAEEAVMVEHLHSLAVLEDLAL
jgi:hypothetical protein